MNAISICPECKQELIKNRSECVCGWRLKNPLAETATDYRCQYQIRNDRCSLPGTMSFSTRGNSWYCPTHYGQLYDANLKKLRINE